MSLFRTIATSLGLNRPLQGGKATKRTVGTPLEEEARAVLRVYLLPAVHRDGGDIWLREIVDKVAFVELTGACATCMAATATLKNGVERTLFEHFPDQIVGVERVF